MIWLVPLRSKLPQVMVDMKVCMAHAFTSRHRTKHSMGSICARPATELIQQGTQAVKIGAIFSRASSAQVWRHTSPTCLTLGSQRIQSFKNSLPVGILCQRPHRENGFYTSGPLPGLSNVTDCRLNRCSRSYETLT